MNFDSFSGREKQKIYGDIEMKLKQDREVDIYETREVLAWLKESSNLDYINQLLHYVRTSLLSYGKLISIDNYLALKESSRV